MISILTALAFDSDRLGVVARGLAVVGGAVIGGFLVGLIAQGVAKLLGAQKIPRPALHIIRLLAAVATGWIMVLIMLNPGGSGFGGPGGDGILPGGRGSGTGSKSSSAGESAVASTSSPSSSSPRYDPDAHVIDVDLLDVEKPSDKKLFRIKGTEKRLTADELREEIPRIKEKMPKLDTLNLIPVGNKYPGEPSPLIQGLKQWGDEVKISVKGP
jgi:hypothetical protein